MKNFSLFIFAAVLMAAASLLVGCSENPAPVVGSEVADYVTVGGDDNSHCVTLLAGQTIPAGTVCLTVDNGSNCATLTFTTINGWELVEAHAWAGLSLANMPQTNSGNPIPGHFPYASGQITGATTWSYCIPLDVFGLDAGMTNCDPLTGYFAAHAALRKNLGNGSYQTESAWGEGTRAVRRGSWAMYFTAVFTCDDYSPPVGTCETAFAFGGNAANCFIGSQLLQANRWGWYNGPLSPGSYSFDIYAGAGQCDLDKGTHAGTLSVNYNGSAAVVTYSMLAGFTMDETHLYVGSDPLPRDRNGEYTVAPGQYGNIHQLTAATTDSYTITGLTGDIYVVAHCVTCSNAWPL